jgi:L-fuculose-phosphate aldolase
MEAGFHSYLYGQFNVAYIAHTHPTNTVKILCTDLVSDFANKRLFPDQVIYNGPKSCVVPYATPGKPLEAAIHNHLNEFLDKNHTFPKLILLQNHGIICCGTTITECIYSTEICEKSASIFLHGDSCSNRLNFLDQEETIRLSIDENEKYRQKLITA